MHLHDERYAAMQHRLDNARAKPCRTRGDQGAGHPLTRHLAAGEAMCRKMDAVWVQLVVRRRRGSAGLQGHLRCGRFNLVWDAGPGGPGAPLRRPAVLL